MEHLLPAAVADAAGVAVGTFKRGLFWGEDVHWGKGSPEAHRGWGPGINPPAREESLPPPLHSDGPAQLPAEVDVFNFGICDGSLQGAVGALEAEQEQAGAPRTVSEGKEVNKP